MIDLPHPPAHPVAWRPSAIFNGQAWLVRDLAGCQLSHVSRTAFEARAVLAQKLGVAPQSLAVEQVPGQ